MNKWHKRYLEIAKQVSKWSKDPSKKVGAICVGNVGGILSQGYNGFPRNISDDPKRYKNKDIKYKYVVHAEMNCIYHATLSGVSLKDSTMYVYGLPVCHECAKAIIQVGIKKVVTYEEFYFGITDKWEESCNTAEDLFKEAGVEYIII